MEPMLSVVGEKENQQVFRSAACSLLLFYNMTLSDLVGGGLELCFSVIVLQLQTRETISGELSRN